MDAATITALGAAAAAAVALLGSVFSIVKWRDERTTRERTMKAQHDQWVGTMKAEHDQWEGTMKAQYDQWENEQKKGVADWQIQFLRDVVQRRVSVYTGVFRTLAAIRDVSEEGHRRIVQEHPERLMKTADELLDHLYGEAGLVMSMSARDQLHHARLACIRFQSDPESIRELMTSFYYARRQLRRDIQLADLESLTTALDDIGKERLAAPQTTNVTSGSAEK